MSKKQPNGVSKIIWPPEKTVKFKFRDLSREEDFIEITAYDTERVDTER